MLTWIRKLKKLILPPAGPLLVALLGLALSATWPRLGTALLAAGFAALFLLSIALVVEPLLKTLDRYPALDPVGATVPSADAIVILDSGRRAQAREHGGPGVKALTLERLFYGAWLYRHLGVPVLVSGGGARELMAEILDESFGVPVRWVEPASRNTHENGQLSAATLRGTGVGRVYLVTHFWHMPRAVAAFQHAGLEVVPAPMGFAFREPGRRDFTLLVPSAAVLYSAYLLVHEWIGLLWYRLRYGHRM